MVVDVFIFAKSLINKNHRDELPGLLSRSGLHDGRAEGIKQLFFSSEATWEFVDGDFLSFRDSVLEVPSTYICCLFRQNCSMQIGFNCMTPGTSA